MSNVRWVILLVLLYIIRESRAVFRVDGVSDAQAMDTKISIRIE